MGQPDGLEALPLGEEPLHLAHHASQLALPAGDVRMGRALKRAS